MNLEARLALSYYEELSPIHKEHDVYLVRHRSTGKLFVKKRLTVYNPEVYYSLLNNPVRYLPQIHELIEDDSALYVIEEYVSGVTLQEYCEENGTLSEHEAVTLILQLCKIVNDLHNRIPPIIHRDIKPSNIILTPSGTLFLLDLNAAKYSDASKERDTTLLGTEGYAAPEQYGFGSSTIQTDIFSIGKVLQFLLSGNISQECTLSSPLGNIIRTCTKLSPESRYANIAALEKAIDDLSRPKAKSAPSKTSGKTFPYLPPGFRTGKPLNMLLAILGYLIITVNVLFMPDPVLLTPYDVYMNTASKWCVFFAFLFLIFFSSNYLDVHRFIPHCKSENRSARIIAIIVADVIGVFLWLLVSGFIIMSFAPAAFVTFPL